MTIIFSKRDDTLFLKGIWKDLPDAKVVEVTSIFDYDRVEDALKQEKDLVILCGHGNDAGLYYPNFEDYIIDENNVNLLRNKTVVCIWCNANDFMYEFQLKGFSTGMFISDAEEALLYNMYDHSEAIPEANELFAKRINEFLKNKVDCSLWIDKLISSLSEEEKAIDFIDYNYNELEYFG